MTGIEAINTATRYFAIADKILQEEGRQHVTRGIYTVSVGGAEPPTMTLALVRTVTGEEESIKVGLNHLGWSDQMFRSEIKAALNRLKARIRQAEK